MNETHIKHTIDFVENQNTDIPKLISEVVGKASDAQVNGDLDATVAWARGQGADAAKRGHSRSMKASST